METMKKLLIITALALFTGINISATKKQLKQELQECLHRNARLDSIIKSAENNYCVTIVEPATKADVKIAKAKEKTKRKIAKQENRTDRQNDKNKKDINAIYQFFFTIRQLGWQTVSALVVGTIGGWEGIKKLFKTVVNLFT